MNITQILLVLISLPLGVFLFIFGGYDDSPGAQLLGVLVAAAGIVLTVRNRKK